MSNFAFGDTPIIRHSRSRFDLSHGVKTSGNVGTLYPFDCQEVYFGDTFKVNTSVVSRLTSQFFRPVVDNLFLDVYYFFVPSRILYDKYVNIFGENTESAWANTQDYEVPTVAGRCSLNTVGERLGIPIAANVGDVSVLPFRAFAKIYEDWFRDQNNVSPMHIQNGEAAASEALNDNPWSPSNYTGRLPKVAKFHDYFTSCLPAPQKGVANPIPIAANAPISIDGTGEVRVTTSGVEVPASGSRYAMRFRSVQENTATALGSGVIPAFGGAGGNGALGAVTPSEYPGTPSQSIYPTNLVANLGDFSGTVDLSDASILTVNDLRFAFQYQKMLERDARGGTRYVEYGLSHFGVSAGDYRLQRSEFLGGRRSPLSIHQVTQTTGSNSDTSPLGQVGAWSLSNSKSRFTKGFTENGYVIGVFCIRQFHTYQQGLEKFWSRKKRTDFYDPVFANIGEQPVYRRELYLTGNQADDELPFGYNEAWADLRYRPNRVTGQLRSGITDSLDIWHFADQYANAPTLNSDFIEETPEYVDRTITQDSSVQDQFLLDFWIGNIAYRALPTYSEPSLIDHN